ncbi:MAG TPA: hypothetical protein VJB59_00925 [Bdellovibrionota bacterium]|nr:hypothetical protein [Bdellovibrionota bacterium]
MKIRVRCFGTLREFAPQGELEMEVTPGVTVSVLRDAIIAHFAKTFGPRFGKTQEELVRASAIATEKTFLDESASIAACGAGEQPGVSTLALLPPVCGG